MLRKTLIALAATAAVGASSAAMAGHPHGSSGSGSTGHPVTMNHPGMQMQSPGSTNVRPGNLRPQTNVRPGNLRPQMSGNTWSGGDRHHHRHHRDRFFAFGF